MSKSWMPLYIDDYLTDTKHLTPLQHGVYLRLIMHYWQNGGLPADDGEMARIVGMPLGPRWKSTCLALASFFEMPGWRHKRIDLELERDAIIKEKRQISGRIGGLRRGYKGPMQRVIDEALAKQTVNHIVSKKEREERARNMPTEGEAKPNGAAALTYSTELGKIIRRKGWAE